MLKKCNIIVEGEGENLDFRVIKELTKEFDKKYKLDVEIVPSESYNQIRESLVKVSPSNLKYFLVIVDADEENVKERFEKIKNKFSENKYKDKFNIPVKLGDIGCSDSEKVNLGIFLLPNNENNGSMDTLAYSALKNKYEEYKDCVKLHRECFKKKGLTGKTTNQKDKFSWHSIIAGLAFRNERYTKFIDFENKNFEALKKFLEQVK